MYKQKYLKYKKKYLNLSGGGTLYIKNIDEEITDIINDVSDDIIKNIPIMSQTYINENFSILNSDLDSNYRIIKSGRIVPDTYKFKLEEATIKHESPVPVYDYDYYKSMRIDEYDERFKVVSNTEPIEAKYEYNLMKHVTIYWEGHPINNPRNPIKFMITDSQYDMLEALTNDQIMILKKRDSACPEDYLIVKSIVPNEYLVNIVNTPERLVLTSINLDIGKLYLRSEDEPSIQRRTLDNPQRIDINNIPFDISLDEKTKLNTIQNNQTGQITIFDLNQIYKETITVKNINGLFYIDRSNGFLFMKGNVYEIRILIDYYGA
jgi:hypothetical protein